jgi:hypothetical protein
MSLWSCKEHGMYGGQSPCPICGETGTYVKWQRPMPWWEKAIRDHETEHGPSGDAWNISAVLERLRSAHQEQINVSGW